MRLNINKIEIHNFMSFADEVIDFNAYKGMNLVTGNNLDIPGSRNGAGKTNGFLALIYCLFGQLPNKVKAENISNRCIEDKEMRLVTYLDIDGNQYKAITGMNKRAQGYFNLMKTEDGNDVDITKSSIAETRQYFEEEIMHCDISLFLRTVMLTSEQNYNFFSLKKQDKKDFIEKLFDIGVFGDMFALIHKDALQSEKAIASTQDQLLVLNQNNDDYITRSSEFDAQHKQQLASKAQMLKQAKDKLNNILTESVQKNDETLTKYEAAQKKIFEAKLKLNEQISTKNSKLSKIQVEISHLQNLKSDRKSIISKHTELLEKLCNDCKKVFDKYHNLSTYRKDITDAQAKIDSLTASQTAEKTEVKEIDTKLIALNEKQDKISEKIQQITSECEKAKYAQKSAEDAVTTLASQLQQLKQQQNPYAKLQEQNTEKIQMKTSELEKLTHEYKHLKKAEEIVSQDSLKKFIIKDLISLINNKIKSYLMKMGAKYTCVFDENLDYEFMTESGKCELQNFSCGEKKRLEIATCLSFRDFIAQRSNLSSNILIIDEYIDSGIDTLAVESILKIFKDFTVNNNQNVFIISHRSEVMSDMFQHTIEIQKKNGISSISV